MRREQLSTALAQKDDEYEEKSAMLREAARESGVQ